MHLLNFPRSVYAQSAKTLIFGLFLEVKGCFTISSAFIPRKQRKFQVSKLLSAIEAAATCCSARFVDRAALTVQNGNEINCLDGFT